MLHKEGLSWIQLNIQFEFNKKGFQIDDKISYSHWLENVALWLDKYHHQIKNAIFVIPV